MMTKKLVVALIVMAFVGLVNAEMTPVLHITNQDASATVVESYNTTYPTGLTGDIIPEGMVGTYKYNAYRLQDATAPSGDGSVQYQIHAGSTWPNNQGLNWTGGQTLTGSYSIAMTINPDYSHAPAQTGTWGNVFGTTWRSILMSTELGWETGEMVLWLDQDTGLVTFQPQSGSGFGDITSSVSLAEGTWYDLLVQVDRENGASRMYLNGSLVGTGIIPDEPEVDIELTLNGLSVGGPFLNYTQCNWQGSIDDYTIYNGVPEPATVTLLAMGLGMLIRRKRS